MQQQSPKELLRERFRCSESIMDCDGVADQFNDSGYFGFGRDLICYGRRSSEFATTVVTDKNCVDSENGHADPLGELDLAQMVNYLRFERYVADSKQNQDTFLTQNAVRNLYYLVRPFMPVAIRKRLQQIYFRGWDKVSFPSWPVDQTVENIFEQLLICALKAWEVERLPFIWFWPDGAPSCAIVTHDVETSAGLKFSSQLMDLNDSFGIKASFQVVPEERYAVSPSLLESIRKRGFEVNVHDLDHDGHLFSNHLEFLRKAQQINGYGMQWGAVGFRSAVLYRNLDWFDALDFDYDMSVPNVAHLDPQRGGCCTVFPFFIGNIVELPVTATQDYSLFHVLGDYSTRLWQKQIALIRAKHGLMNFIIHPDYIIPKRERGVYSELLSYLSELRSQRETWIALPREVAAWWRMRSKMSLANKEGSWRIEGKGSDRARIVYAVLSGDKICYEFD